MKSSHQTKTTCRTDYYLYRGSVQATLHKALDCPMLKPYATADKVTTVSADYLANPQETVKKCTHCFASKRTLRNRVYLKAKRGGLSAGLLTSTE